MNWFGIKQLLKLNVPRLCNERAIDWWLREIRKGRVISGPFAGTRYLAESYGSSLYPKLLGTYEKELADLWKPEWVRGFDAIINIGCAEAYYLAGLGRMTRRSQGGHTALFGYDLSEKAIVLAQRLLEQNQLDASNLLAGPFDGGGLDKGQVLVVCDIEGGEEEEMDPERWPGLREAVLVIEVHDEPGSSRMLDLLKHRFGPTHSINHYRFRERAASDFPSIRWPRFSLSTKRRLVDEDRLYGKDWLVCIPLSQSLE